MKKIFKPLVLLFAYFLTSNCVIVQKDSTMIVKKTQSIFNYLDWGAFQ